MRARRLFSITGLEDFRCSAALRGLLGVRLALADAPVSGEALGFPGVSAGMVRPRASRYPAERAAKGRGRAHGVPRPSRAGPRRQARAGSQPRGYLRKTRRGVCEPGSAFFPTLAPANERLRSALTPPTRRRAARPRPPPPTTVSHALAPGPPTPRVTKGGWNTPPAPAAGIDEAGKITAPPRSERRARRRPFQASPGRGSPGLGRVGRLTFRLNWGPGRGGAQSSPRAAREIREENLRGEPSQTPPRSGRASANTPPSSSAVPGPRPPGPRASAQPPNLTCRVLGLWDPHRLQHLRKTCDTVDVEHQPLGRREVGWTRSRGNQGGITAQLNDGLRPVRVLSAGQLERCLQSGRMTSWDNVRMSLVRLAMSPDNRR